MNRTWGWSIGFCLLLMGCGSTIGDPCTTAADCGNAVCINQSYTPGGYCSSQCVTDGDCPPGSTCVPEGGGTGLNACFRLCTAAKDCRRGYDCLPARETGRSVCVGTTGF